MATKSADGGREGVWTALTPLTVLTALTADVVDEIDVIEGIDIVDEIDVIEGVDIVGRIDLMAELFFAVNEVNNVNLVRCQHSQSCQHRQCRQKCGRLQAAWQLSPPTADVLDKRTIWDRSESSRCSSNHHGWSD